MADLLLPFRGGGGDLVSLARRSIKDAMSPDRRQRLDVIGFVWKVR
jgi:hypothetical protein